MAKQQHNNRLYSNQQQPQAFCSMNSIHENQPEHNFNNNNNNNNFNNIQYYMNNGDKEGNFDYSNSSGDDDAISIATEMINAQITDCGFPIFGQNNNKRNDEDFYDTMSVYDYEPQNIIKDNETPQGLDFGPFKNKSEYDEWKEPLATLCQKMKENQNSTNQSPNEFDETIVKSLLRHYWRCIGTNLKIRNHQQAVKFMEKKGIFKEADEHDKNAINHIVGGLVMKTKIQENCFEIMKTLTSNIPRGGDELFNNIAETLKVQSDFLQFKTDVSSFYVITMGASLYKLATTTLPFWYEVWEQCQTIANKLNFISAFIIYIHWFIAPKSNRETILQLIDTLWKDDQQLWRNVVTWKEVLERDFKQLLIDDVVKNQNNVTAFRENNGDLELIQTLFKKWIHIINGLDEINNVVNHAVVERKEQYDEDEKYQQNDDHRTGLALSASFAKCSQTKPSVQTVVQVNERLIYKYKVFDELKHSDVQLVAHLKFILKVLDKHVLHPNDKNGEMMKMLQCFLKERLKGNKVKFIKLILNGYGQEMKDPETFFDSILYQFCSSKYGREKTNNLRDYWIYYSEKLIYLLRSLSKWVERYQMLASNTEYAIRNKQTNEIIEWRTDHNAFKLWNNPRVTMSSRFGRHKKNEFQNMSFQQSNKHFASNLRTWFNDWRVQKWLNDQMVPQHVFKLNLRTNISELKKNRGDYHEFRGAAMQMTKLMEDFQNILHESIFGLFVFPPNHTITEVLDPIGSGGGNGSRFRPKKQNRYHVEMSWSVYGKADITDLCGKNPDVLIALRECGFDFFKSIRYHIDQESLNLMSPHGKSHVLGKDKLFEPNYTKR